MAIEQLFVYGTLAPGRENAHILADLKGTWATATIRGYFYPHGLEGTAGYPVVTLDEQGDLIKGFIFNSKELSHFWQSLDDFEGEGYQRVQVIAEFEDGQPTQAYVYVLNINHQEVNRNSS